MNLLTEFAEYIFREIIYTDDGITPEILDWKPVEEANSIRWILTHQTRIAYLFIPEIIHGTQNPAGWDDDFQEQPHSLEELRNDLREARENVLSLLDKLTEEDLNKEIQVWGSMNKNQPLKQALFALLGELMHHNGQIAFIQGSIKRLRERNILYSK